jgi:hypothetical protein
VDLAPLLGFQRKTEAVFQVAATRVGPDPPREPSVSLPKGVGWTAFCFQARDARDLPKTDAQWQSTRQTKRRHILCDRFMLYQVG